MTHKLISNASIECKEFGVTIMCSRKDDHLKTVTFLEDGTVISNATKFNFDKDTLSIKL